MRRKVAGSPTPPAQMTGRPRSPSSSSSASATVLPAWPPATLFTRDQAVYAAVDGLLRPLSFGDVVVDDAADLGRSVDHPARIAERGDEEPHALLEGDVDPSFDALAVGFRRLLDERVHAKRAGSGLLDEPQPVAKIVAVDVGHRHRLHDADARRRRTLRRRARGWCRGTSRRR